MREKINVHMKMCEKTELVFSSGLDSLIRARTDAKFTISNRVWDAVTDAMLDLRQHVQSVIHERLS